MAALQKQKEDPPRSAARVALPSSGVLLGVAQRDSKSMETCIDRFGPMVNAVARRFLGRAEDVEEAVQDIFSDLWRHASRFDPAAGSEVTFVMTLARRRLIDRKRREARKLSAVGLTGSEASDDRGDFERVDRSDDVRHVQEAVSQLRPDERQALRLAIYEGMSHREISEALGVPLGTIKSHVRRALLRVRDMLRSRGTRDGGLA